MTTPVTAACQLVFTTAASPPAVSLKMGEEYTPAVVQYQRTSRPMDVGSAVPKLTKGVRIRSIAPGTANLKLFYTGEEPVPVTIIRGEGEIISRGWRQEEVEQLVRFQGESSVPIASPTPPTLLYQTNFYNSQGNLVTPPVYYPGGGQGELRHEQPVYGAMILQVTQSYQAYRLFYSALDYFLTCDPDGHIQQAGGSGLSPVVVAAMPPFDFAMIAVSRRVDLQDITSRLREGNRVEVGRRGVIDRVFPTPPFQPGTPAADPRTGRTDYMDIERVTAVRYRVDIFDEDGNVDSTAYRQENLENSRPENSYTLQSFNRHWEG